MKQKDIKEHKDTEQMSSVRRSNGDEIMPLKIHVDIEVPLNAGDEVKIMMLLEEVMILTHEWQWSEKARKRVLNWFYKKWHDDECE